MDDEDQSWLLQHSALESDVTDSTVSRQSNAPDIRDYDRGPGLTLRPLIERSFARCDSVVPHLISNLYN